MNNTVEKNLNIKIEKEVVGAECGEKKKKKKESKREDVLLLVFLEFPINLSRMTSM